MRQTLTWIAGYFIVSVGLGLLFASINYCRNRGHHDDPDW